ncbi:ATP-binding protein [Kitasatospora sp. NPDC090091]|uniref:ATP-binding protein n=1 Tax=Kitasatospora sp. NPDC090091 TaxID=3364081 RepID=UPI0037F6118E
MRELELPCARESVGQAREFVRTCWTDLLPNAPRGKANDAELAVSEMVTIALSHQPTEMCVRVAAIESSRCRIVVADNGRTSASPPALGRGSAGIGMVVVAALGTVGHELTSRGTTLWVDLTFPGPTPGIL